MRFGSCDLKQLSQLFAVIRRVSVQISAVNGQLATPFV
jgi:hypothetical protein